MVFVLIMLLIFACDLAVKYRITNGWKGERKLLKEKLLLRKMENPGLAMGRMQRHPKLILLVTGSLLMGVTAFFLKTLRRTGNIPEKLGLSLMLGGGWNNWYDRLIKGSVTDYVSINCRWQRIRNIVFNISDAAIFLGAILAGIGGIIGSFNKR